jgi:hypothetical protein
VAESGVAVQVKLHEPEQELYLLAVATGAKPRRSPSGGSDCCASCGQCNFEEQLQIHTPGLTPTAVLEKLANGTDERCLDSDV